jgi:hypothetical protein
MGRFQRHALLTEIATVCQCGGGAADSRTIRVYEIADSRVRDLGISGFASVYHQVRAVATAALERAREELGEIGD